MQTATSFDFNFTDLSNYNSIENKLKLVGADNEHGHVPFLVGNTFHNKSFTDMLLALSSVVHTNYAQMSPPFTDPAITCHEDVVRFEGFSTCCGVYARVDVKAEFFDPKIIRRGTTNVDFSDQTRAALAQFRSKKGAKIEVGNKHFEFISEGKSHFEKKVTLPPRWIKSFAEVQAYLPKMKPVARFTKAQCRNFFMSLPESTTRNLGNAYANYSYNNLRLSQSKMNSIPISGLHRLAAVKKLLLRHLDQLDLYFDESSDCSAWVIHNKEMTFTFVLSPDTYRGFSGEGQLLSLIASHKESIEKTHVEAALRWQSHINEEEIAKELKLGKKTVNELLLILGAQGHVGYDLKNSSHFHRSLPFAQKNIEQSQPRLKAARKLVEAEAISLLEDKSVAEVQSKDNKYFIYLDDEMKCTCQWYGKYQGKRGPCKHILATQIFIDSQK